MGNCTGFCVTSNNVAGDDGVTTKKVTSDLVKSALQEKEELFSENRYFDNDTEQALQNNHNSRNNTVQLRKLGTPSYTGNGLIPLATNQTEDDLGVRQSLPPQTLEGGVIYTG